jgi:hypothetical protein
MIKKYKNDKKRADNHLISTCGRKIAASMVAHWLSERKHS